MTRQQRRAEARRTAKTRSADELSDQGHTGPVYNIGEPVPASQRGGFRTKGESYSRCKMLQMIAPKRPGMPGTIRLKHPRTGFHRLRITERLLKVFMPSAPETFYNHMLGLGD